MLGQPDKLQRADLPCSLTEAFTMYFPKLQLNPTTRAGYVEWSVTAKSVFGFRLAFAWSAAAGEAVIVTREHMS